MCGSGQCEDKYLVGPRFSEYSGAFVQCCSGVVEIIQKEDGLSLYDLPLTDAKGPSYVPPFLRDVFHVLLRPGGTCLDQRSWSEGDMAFLRQVFGQAGYGIVGSIFFGRGDRNEHIGLSIGLVIL